MNVCIGTTPGRDLALKVNIDLEKNFLLFPFFLLQTLKVKMKQDSRVYSHGQLCEREVRAI